MLDADGNNTVETMEKNGRFAVIQRLTGVSTTDVTGKLLNLIEKVQAEFEC